MPETNEHWLAAFSAAFHARCSHFNVDLVGGNLARGQLSLTIQVMGAVPSGRALKRSGARHGDNIYVTGSLGDAAAGLACLKSGMDHAQLVHRFEMPEPRLNVGTGLIGLASSCIDVSDGFVADLRHICEASQLAAQIELEALPLSQQINDHFETDKVRELALYGGDDYELCFTAPPQAEQNISELARALGCPITRVGQMVDGVPGVQVAGEPLAAAGYLHF